MRLRLVSFALGVAALAVAGASANAAEPGALTYADALALARRAAPDLAVARGREAVAAIDVRVAGVYPNPSILAGTSTQTAKLSAGASIPLVIFGQRGAAMDASQAEAATTRVETQMTWNDVRAGTAKAFVGLWLAERTAAARENAAAIALRLDNAVAGRVELGASPPVEGLRAHSEQLRATADAQEARRLVAAAASDLGRWIGAPGAADLRTAGDPDIPDGPPPFAALSARVAGSPAVRREEADARAADARASRERALVRPQMTLDLGFDAYDPTLCPGATGSCNNPPVNYRGQLTVEVPLFNQRGPLIDREEAAAAVARARADAERTRGTSDLALAYRTFEAVSDRTKALETGVVPAALRAADATEESYKLGHSPLVAVLDAERASIDAQIALLEARATRASAWIDVEHAVGQP
jgi:outer membrane protein TolC